MKQPSLKNDNICPICASRSIKSGAKVEGKEGLRGGNRIPIDAVTHVALDNYVCVHCGYVESYIADRGILNRIAKLWAKVEVKNEGHET
jgi:predicted nucleic-acid-binding Zn-ribbon protein